MRKTTFENEKYYHIVNRGVDKRIVFDCEQDYSRFLTSLFLLNSEDSGVMERWRNYTKNNPEARLADFVKAVPNFSEKLVEIICYCLNPNHFHILLKQLKNKGVEQFMHKVSTSYTNYFNKKHGRSGSLFQGPFRAVEADSGDCLLYLSVYINKNNFIHGYQSSEKLSFKNPKSLASDVWPYCSLPDYLGKRSGTLCQKDAILSQFGYDLSEYSKYAEENALHFKQKKEFAKYMLEELNQS